MTNLTIKLAGALLCLVPLAACSQEDASHAADSAKKTASATGDKLVEMKDKFVSATQKEMDDLGVKYDEMFVRTAEGWRFHVREATRLWSLTTPSPHEPLLADRAAARAANYGSHRS